MRSSFFVPPAPLLRCSTARLRSPIFHLIGNVTKDSTGSIKLEPINDASGVTYKDGIYHAWHQCCQNHWDHAISKDLMHWQRLP